MRYKALQFYKVPLYIYRTPLMHFYMYEKLLIQSHMSHYKSMCTYTT